MNSKRSLRVALLRVSSPTSDLALTMWRNDFSSPRSGALIAELKEEKAFASEFLAGVL